MPVISIKPVVESDLPEIGELLTTSKLALTINRLLWRDWPNLPAQKAQYLQAAKGGLHDPASESLKLINEESGEILGYMIFTRKQAKKQQETGEEVKEADLASPDIPEVFNPGVLKMVIKGVGELNEKVEGFDRFEITYIVVKVGHRRQGFGSRLLQVAIERARSAKIPLCAQAEPAAYDFLCKKHGFVELKHADFDLRHFAVANSGFGDFRLAQLILRP